LLIANGIICAVCCIAFPRFVGPIDFSGGALLAHDPSFRLERANSTPGTQAYVEIGPPISGMPGCMVFNVVNNTEHRIGQVTVQYPLRHPIVYNPRTTDPDITVTRHAACAHFTKIDPHVPMNKAFDYRDPSIPVAPNSPASALVPSNTASPSVNLGMVSE
jgi:hypothetical protein